jgi:peptide/nickel transport system permease protein
MTAANSATDVLSPLERPLAPRAFRWGRGIRRFVRTQPLGAVGAVIVMTMIVLALFAEQIAPEGENQVNIFNVRQGMSWDNPFGTDHLGRDIFSRVVLGSRISVAVGVFGTLISTALALTIGLLSGYFRGFIDLAIQRVVDAVMSVPGLIVLLSLLAIVPPSLTNIILILGIYTSVGSSRVVRSLVLSIRSEPYIQAATVMGASNLRIMLRHILPNVLPITLVTGTTLVGGLVLTEGALSFLGVGIPPPSPSWGGMLAQGRIIMLEHPLVILWPGIFLALFVFGWNMLGDGLRDALDPRLRKGT